MRECSRCGNSYDNDGFYSSKGVVRGECKFCTRKKMKAAYAFRKAKASAETEAPRGVRSGSIAGIKASPRSVDCPSCGAKAGELCWFTKAQDSEGKWIKLTTYTTRGRKYCPGRWTQAYVNVAFEGQVSPIIKDLERRVEAQARQIARLEETLISL